MGSYQAMVPKATATRIDSWSINGVVKNLLARAFLSLKSSDSLGQWLSAIAGTLHDVVHRSYLHWLTIAAQTSDGSLGLWNMIGRGGSLLRLTENQFPFPEVPYILRLFVKYLEDTKSNDYEQDRIMRNIRRLQRKGGANWESWKNRKKLREFSGNLN